jgi:hypothetical protein
MKDLILPIYLLYPPDTTKYEQQPLTAKFTDAIKKRYGCSMSAKAKQPPLFFIQPNPNGNIIANPAIRNRRFSIQYKKVTSGSRKENWITSLKEIAP